MRLVIRECLRDHDALLADADFKDFVERARRDEATMQLAVSLVRRCDDPPLLHSHGSKLVATQPRRQRDSCSRLLTLVQRLAARHNSGHIKGMFVEAIVEGSLRTRYAGTNDVLKNNVKFDLEDIPEPWSSNARSIDVIGFDGKRGEAHDCKFDPSKFEADWIAELETSVAPHGFRIGLASAASRTTMSAALAGVAGRESTLLPVESCLERLPLQSPAG